MQLGILVVLHFAQRPRRLKHLKQTPRIGSCVLLLGVGLILGVGELARLAYARSQPVKPAPHGDEDWPAMLKAPARRMMP